MERYSWDGQMALAEEMVAPWRSALEKIGVRTVRGSLYRQFVKRGGNLSSRRRDLSRNAGAE